MSDKGRSGKRPTEGGMTCQRHQKPIVGCLPTKVWPKASGGRPGGEETKVEWARPVCVDCQLPPVHV
jgi:hypothetical protein